MEGGFDTFDCIYINNDWKFKIRFNKLKVKPWEVFYHKEEGVVSPCVVTSWHTENEAREYAGAQNRLYLSSFFQKQSTQAHQILDNSRLILARISS